MTKLITILLPCLNEEKTLDKCIKLIKKTMNNSKYKKDYSLLVCDNGSTDNSINICKKNRVEYTICNNKGYGNTLLNGINISNSKYLVMLDSDLSYDEKDIPMLIDKLEEDYDFVIGNRFKGTIEKHAMPLSHSIGSRILTEYGNILFQTKSHDYHCGLRAFNREKVLNCNLNSTGFEFASEMIIKAKINKLKMLEVPTNLFKDGRDRPPYLKAIKDGLRHFNLITKVKFNNSIIFRYFTTFITVILFFLITLFLTNLIPHKLVSNNSQKSIIQLTEMFNKKSNIKNPYSTFEEEGDLKNFAIIYSSDSNHPIKSMIEMNYPIECDKSQTCYLISNNSMQLINYSRYWHGQTTILKPLTIFFDIKTINIIIMTLFIILFTYTLIMLFKTDKLFSIAFFLASLSINIFFVPKSFQYVLVFIIMLIGMNIIRRLYNNKSKYIDIFFLIIGMLTCFYDFLTVETITLTMPLLFYLYLKIKNKEKISYKEILIFITLWGIGYVGTFLTKWFIDILHYGPDILSEIIYDASIRTWNSDNQIMDLEFSIINNFIPIIPFVYINNGHIICLVLLILLLSLDTIILKKYNNLHFIVLIPLIRYLVLTFHSSHLYFFTYRALLPVIIISILIIISFIKYIIPNNQ